MASTDNIPPLPKYVIPFGTKANCTLDICPVEYSVYRYRPSLAANWTFIALYILATFIHAYLGIRWKSWWFMSCSVLGGANAVMGYIGRVVLYYNPFNFVAFMIQIICISSGPVYYCAAIYVTLSFAINTFGPSLSRVPPRLFYYFFLPCDFVSLVLQGAGGALSVASVGASQVGVNLALVGLALQVFTMVLFAGLFADYIVRYARTADGRAVLAATRVRLFFGFMGLAILLILARCAYRLAELNEGYKGHLVKDEGLFIGLEGVLVVTSVYCLMIGHPGLVFNRDRKAASTRDYSSGEIEMAHGQRIASS